MAILFLTCILNAQDAARGFISIDCKRIDAEVFIDGKKIGSPPVVPQKVSAGNHEIVVVAPEAKVFVRTVSVSAGETVRVKVVLKELSGSISVITDPAGALVSIDGRIVGESPVDIEEVRKGGHVIKARLDGYETREKEIDLLFGEELSVFLRMRKKEAVFSVFSFPTGADVYLDDKKIGVTPMKLKNFEPGIYDLKVVREEGFAHEQKVTLVKGRDLALDITLPIPGAVLIVDPGPQARKLFVDGREYCEINSRQLSVPPGEQLVEVKGWKGKILYSRHMKLEKGESYSLEIKPFLQLQKDMELKGHDRELLALTFSPDGKQLASASKSGELILWDISGGKVLVKVDAHEDGIASLAFSPTGDRLVTGSWDGTMKLWDSETGRMEKSFEIKKSVNSVAWSQSGGRVAAGCAGGLIVLYDLTDDWKASVLTGHIDTVRSLFFDYNGKNLVSGGAGGRIVIRNASDGAERWKIVESSPVNSVIFTGSGQYVVSGCEDGKTRIRRRGEEKVLALIKAQPHWISNIVPAWDEVFAATGDGESVILLDAEGRKPILDVEGVNTSATAIAFERGGRFMAVGSRDGVIKFWLAQ